MADVNLDSLAQGARDIFLAGVGLAATGVDKSKEIIDALVKKGEITVEQGKDLNTELSRKAKDKATDAISDAQDRLLRVRLAAMSDQERQEYVAKVSRLAVDLSKKKDSQESADNKESGRQAADGKTTDKAHDSTTDDQAAGADK